MIFTLPSAQRAPVTAAALAAPPLTAGGEIDRLQHVTEMSPEVEAEVEMLGVGAA